MEVNAAIVAELSLSRFTGILDILDKLQPEVNVQFLEEGMRIQALDTTNICYIQIHVPRSDFKRYILADQVCRVLGWDVRAVSKMVKVKSDTVVIVYHAEKSDVVTFRMDTRDGGSSSEFSMKLMEIDSETLEVPDVDDEDVTVIAKMTCGKFGSVVSQLHEVNSRSGGITISARDGDIHFDATGTSGSGHIVLKCTSLKGGGSGIKVEYSCDFIKRFCRGSCLGGEYVILRMTEGQPLRLEYPFLEESCAEFILAPKISSDASDMDV
jgi:proliferating cell nuclear antigen